MTLEQAQRLVRLIDAYRKTARQLDSLVRRICALLDSAPAEALLRETALDAIETVGTETLLLLSERILRAREGINDTDNNNERDKEPRNGDD